MATPAYGDKKGDGLFSEEIRQFSIPCEDGHFVVVRHCHGFRAHGDECLLRSTYEDTKVTWTVLRCNSPTPHSCGDAHLDGMAI
jgi:hypothetical protein